MTDGDTTDAGKLGGVSTLRYGSQLSVLGATGGNFRHGVGDSSGMVDKSEIAGDMFRYRVEVDGTGINECYEYDTARGEAEVRADWLSDVAEQWGEPMADAFRGRVSVTALWETQEETTRSEGSPIALPPPDREAGEQ